LIERDAIRQHETGSSAIVETMIALRMEAIIVTIASQAIAESCLPTSPHGPAKDGRVPADRRAGEDARAWAQIIR
jgi:hypothetical protein